MNEFKSSIGRIVHYMSYGTPNGEYKSEPRAAIITAVLKNNCKYNRNTLSHTHYK